MIIPVTCGCYCRLLVVQLLIQLLMQLMMQLLMLQSRPAALRTKLKSLEA